ncbi:serine/threonine-protein kinase [Streptomyces aidingensis]|uniref:Serine/threonine protein kinase n=1 Tax=Streptomyces aidingensis TaxID=910347 RepID=A0A1I1Q8T3_9ACTN|nr:serine/threonine-protein kinase [Streptomyces aidingensis]SFD15623.1 Serine/threonine protein kinase [Streptomyces aidingensis]
MKALGADDPQSAGPYRLLARLGAGGMGQVYLARSDRGRTVAVKLVQPELARQPEFRQRFRHEVDAARRVGGQWTAPVLDADPDATVPWVATGYVAGPSLHEVVTGPTGPLPERSLLALANGLTRALGDIHTAGLVHRDLKPSNVLITIDGPRVIDFGIARVLETAPGAGLTRTGATVGSPGFMSPEQCRGETLTPASDIFCMGSVLVFAATGRTPFGRTDSQMHALMLRIVQNEKDLSGIPERISGIIEDCLAPDPADRPTLDELLDRTSAGDLWEPEPGDDPWLPGALVARLGRHAVELLDSEDPLREGGAPVPPAMPTTPPPGPAPTAPAHGAGMAGMHTMPAGMHQQTPPPPHTPHPAMGGQFWAAQPGQQGPPVTPMPGQFGQVVPVAQGRSKRLGIILAACGAVFAVLVAGGVVYAMNQDDNGGGSTAGGNNGGSDNGGSDTGGTDNGGTDTGGTDNGGTDTGGSDAGGSDTGGTGLTSEDIAGYWEGEVLVNGASQDLTYRFEIFGGEEGEDVGYLYGISPDSLCAGYVNVSSQGEGEEVTITTSELYDVPDGACTYDGESGLSLDGDGNLYWNHPDTGITGTFYPAVDAGAESAVPEPYLGTWGLDVTDQDGSYHTITVDQGFVTESLLTWVRDGEGEEYCDWRHTLMAVGPDEEWLLFGPSESTSSEPSGLCLDGGMHSFYLYPPDSDGDVQVVAIPTDFGNWYFSPE